MICRKSNRLTVKTSMTESAVSAALQSNRESKWLSAQRRLTDKPTSTSYAKRNPSKAAVVYNLNGL